MASVQFSHIFYFILLGLVIWQSTTALPVPTGTFDTTEAYEDNSSTVEKTNFEQTTNKNNVLIQQAKQQPVGRASDSSSSSDSSTYSGGVIAGISVGAISGILFCCICLCCLGKLCG